MKRCGLYSCCTEMEIFKIVAVGLLTAVAAWLVRDSRSDVAVAISVAGGVIILTMLIDYFTGVFAFFDELVNKTGVDRGVIKTLLKIVGIGYIAELAAGVCEESGAKSAGDKIILGGKLIIFTLTIPILRFLLDIIGSLLS